MQKADYLTKKGVIRISLLNRIYYLTLMPASARSSIEYALHRP
jgi:hypothetical protein